MNKAIDKMSSTQLLNLYINSGGKKASYDDVVNAVRKEKISKDISELKLKYKIFSFLFISFYFLNLFVDKLNNDNY